MTFRSGLLPMNRDDSAWYLNMMAQRFAVGRNRGRQQSVRCRAYCLIGHLNFSAPIPLIYRVTAGPMPGSMPLNTWPISKFALARISHFFKKYSIFKDLQIQSLRACLAFFKSCKVAPYRKMLTVDFQFVVNLLVDSFGDAGFSYIYDRTVGCRQLDR